MPAPALPTGNGMATGLREPASLERGGTTLAFWRSEAADQRASSPVLVWFSGLFILAIAAMTMDATLRANGFYGTRTLAVEKVVDKRMVYARRSSTPMIYLAHRGQRLGARVMADEYERIAIGERLKVVIVPGRFGNPHVFLDRPGFKHDPHSRMVMFGLIIVTHFAALFGLFHWFLARARRRSSTASNGLEARLLGLRQP
jgi:hypothetical protein